MDTQETTRTAAILDWPTRAPGSPSPSVVTELEVIVGRSRRRMRVRRALSRIGARFARWADHLVPPAPAGDREPPPEIRFPFF